MMKKRILPLFLALIVAFLVLGTAAAKNDKINTKGQVISTGEGTVTIETKKGTYQVAVPEGFDLDSLQEGDWVLVKGRITGEGTIEADAIKQVGGKKSKEKGGKGEIELDEDDKPEGKKDHSAFCAEGKKDKPHPLAVKLAARYGVTEEWVMGYYCEGYSVGAIMLALKTSQLEGLDVDPETLLEARSTGNSWGHIWQELGLIGKAKDGHSPPGHLKRPDKSKPGNRD